jgi:hypothetical protein
VAMMAIVKGLRLTKNSISKAIKSLSLTYNYTVHVHVLKTQRTTRQQSPRLQKLSSQFYTELESDSESEDDNSF